MDPIADMLTRVRNAIISKHDQVEIPVSNMKIKIAEILLSEGFIKDFKVEGEGFAANIVIALKYGPKKETVISGLKRISKPGLRIYSGVEDLPKVLGGMGIAIVSTSKGLMTDKQARLANIGGEVLAYVW